MLFKIVPVQQLNYEEPFYEFESTKSHAGFVEFQAL